MATIENCPINCLANIKYSTERSTYFLTNHNIMAAKTFLTEQTAKVKFNRDKFKWYMYTFFSGEGDL